MRAFEKRQLDIIFNEAKGFKYRRPKLTMEQDRFNVIQGFKKTEQEDVYYAKLAREELEKQKEFKK